MTEEIRKAADPAAVDEKTDKLKKKKRERKPFAVKLGDYFVSTPGFENMKTRLNTTRKRTSKGRHNSNPLRDKKTTKESIRRG